MNPLDSLISKPPIAERNWSPLQQAIFDGSGPQLIQAVAGSGKTTTIVELTGRRGGNGLFLAFNKAIALDIASKVRGAGVKTLNALGHMLVSRKRPGAKLDQWRVSKRVRQVLNAEDYKMYGQAVQRSISLAKANAIFEPTFHDFGNLIDAYELDVYSDMIPMVAKVAERVWKDLEKNIETFDFDDQLYLPIRHDWIFPAYDFVYVDEAQDLSLIQHLMVQKLAERGAIICAVGDRFQAIYGFRGATHDSMDNMKKLFSMEEYPLSISYRCCNSVVAEAQKIVPHIQPAPNAPDGEVLNDPNEFFPSSFSHGDLIVCRNNAPIFSLALQFIQAKQPCQVLSSFIDTMESWIESFECTSTKDFRIKLDVWFKKESDECINNNRLGRLEGIRDRYDVLREMSQEFSTTGELISAIRRLAASTSGPRIATIHKAKGLEATNVSILRPDLLPSPRATSQAQLQAEANLKYVAVTRAKRKLSFLLFGTQSTGAL